MSVPRPTPADAGVAALLVGLALVELVVRGEASSRDIAVALLATVPTAWRGPAPRAALSLCVLALVWLSTTRTDEFTVAQLLALMLMTYTAAVHEHRRAAVVALLAVLVAAVANSAAAGSRQGGDYVFPVILLGVPWAAGRALRRWRERTEELREVTVALREEREQHARLAVAAERGRIARELHDSLAQSLNAVVVHAEVAGASLGRDDSRAARSLDRIGAVARSSLADTRRLLEALRDLADHDSPRLHQLAALVDERRADGMEVDLRIEGDASSLPPQVEAAVVRIVQESLTNVAKHSRAGSSRVRLCLADVVTVRVEDDGPPLAPEGHRRSGLGLVGMRERAVLLGGTFSAQPDGRGFLVKASIPRGAPS